jgi:hypothetical protein
MVWVFRGISNAAWEESTFPDIVFAFSKPHCENVVYSCITGYAAHPILIDILTVTILTHSLTHSLTHLLMELSPS